MGFLFPRFFFSKEKAVIVRSGVQISPFPLRHSAGAIPWATFGDPAFAIPKIIQKIFFFPDFSFEKKKAE